MTDKVIAAIDLMHELAVALKLPDETYSIKLNLDIDDAAQILVKSYLTNEQAEVVRRILTSYALCNPQDVSIVQPTPGNYVDVPSVTTNLRYTTRMKVAE